MRRKQMPAQACRLAMLTCFVVAFLAVASVFPGKNSAPLFITALFPGSKLAQTDRSSDVTQFSGSPRLLEATQSPTVSAAAEIDPTFSPTHAATTSAPTTKSASQNTTIKPSERPTPLPTDQPTKVSAMPVFAKQL